MLVFFKLHNSEIYTKYVQLQLRKESDLLFPDTRSPSTAASTAGIPVISIPAPFFSVPGFARDTEGTDGSIPIPTLVRALTQTKELLGKLMQGNATAYYETTELNLETLDVERELEVLASFTTYLNLPASDQTQLTGVQNMLELANLVRAHRHIMEHELSPGYEEKLQRNDTTSQAPLCSPPDKVLDEVLNENSCLREKQDELKEKLLKQQDAVYELKESVIKLETTLLQHQKETHQLEVTLLEQQRENRFLRDNLLHQQQEKQQVVLREGRLEDHVQQLERTLQQHREEARKEYWQQVKQIADREEELKREIKQERERATYLEQEL